MRRRPGRQVRDWGLATKADHAQARVPRTRILAVVVAAVFVLGAGAVPVRAQAEHAAQPAAASEHQAAAGAAHGEGEGGAGHGEPLTSTIARLFNFALLAGSLVYLLKSPLAAYLASRAAEVRARLVKAAEMRAAAAAETADVDRKLQTLPAELDRLRASGAEEVAAEEARVRQSADAERARLLEVTRRDIGMHVRLAERDLMRQAATLAVAVATDRVKASITDADQLRLVDRYLAQVGTETGGTR